jgi:uncharacterized OsmC-like protein
MTVWFMNETSITYHVTATRAGEPGFNAAESLLAALGARILTKVNAIGENMRLQINQVRMEFEAARCDEVVIEQIC